MLLKIFLIIGFNVFAQVKTAKDYGFTHLVYNYKNNKVDILIKSKVGEENTKKPLFFFCQGSLPQPLIKVDEKGVYGVFPFIPDSLAVKYHLVIVSKPSIPLVVETKLLNANYCYTDSAGKLPKKYTEKNLLDYYVDRNLEIISYLQKQNWVSSNRLVVAGHSEGSTVAAKMASKSSAITHLIYSGGNPLGRIMSIIQENRTIETDSTKYAEEDFNYWQYIVDNKTDMDDSQGDTPKATYDFSIPPIEYLKKIKIPVLVCYGTKDYSAPFNDYMRADFIRNNKKKVSFKAYIGTEHNYFPLTKENKPDYSIFNWDKVAYDWLKWLN